MYLENCEIIENKLVAGKNYLMVLKGDKTIGQSKAGQFFMLQCKNGIFFLRRPISLHYVDKENKELEFYYEVKGQGTKDLANLKKGDVINIQGPLGHGFTTDINNKNILVVGGGMGIAPMKLLIEKLKRNNKVDFIAGGRNKEAVEILNNFSKKDYNKYVVTDDGSIGEKGNVILIMEKLLKEKKYDLVMTCGPQKMMEAVAKVSLDNSIECEISLEARMACGVKACVGCSIKTKKGMQKVCYDGPVFDAKDIVEYNPKESSNICCGN